MTGLKMEIMGLGIIALGIAYSMNNFWSYTLGAIGFGAMVAGLFYKDKNKR